MKYLFVGATSGTGKAVLRRLVMKLGSEFIECLVRPTSQVEEIKSLGVRLHLGDVAEPESYLHLLGPSVIYLDMTHSKHYHHSLEAVLKTKVERAYFVTTTGVFSSYNQFSEIYKVNEAKIRASRVTYIILRPSMIYGHPKDKNMNRLIRFLCKYPVFPFFDAGRSLMQPVFEEDLADGIVAAIGEQRTENQECNLAGPEAIPYRSLIQTILDVLQRRVFILNVPFGLASSVARLGERIPGFPITHEQVLRLQEDKAFDISKAVAELSYKPRPFAIGVEGEITQMRAQGML